MYKIKLSVRYLFKRRVSYFAIAAIALCVFVALVVITVLVGLTNEFREKGHVTVGDCVISTKSLVGFGYYDEFTDILDSTEIVKAVSPVISSYAIVKSVPGSMDVRYVDRTLKVMGIDPASHSSVTGFAKWLHYNKADTEKAFTPTYDSNSPGFVMGIGLLFDRDSDGQYIIPKKIPEIKVEVSCFPLNAKGALAKAGAGVVSSKTFAMSDCAQTGVSYDWETIYLPFDQAQMLCGMANEPKRINAIYIKFEPGVELEAGCEKIKHLWADFVRQKAGASQANLLEKTRVQSWKIYNRSMVAVAETQQALVIIIFAMIGIITVFIVFVVFYMIICHKSKDIGVLRSVGVSSANVFGLFLGFAFLMGLLASTIGALGGWRFLVNINQIEDWLFKHFEFQLWDRAIFAIGDIPNSIDLKVLTCIIASAIAACMLGALIPSWQAAKQKPVETLQVNQL